MTTQTQQEIRTIVSTEFSIIIIEQGEHSPFDMFCKSENETSGYGFAYAMEFLTLLGFDPKTQLCYINDSNKFFFQRFPDKKSYRIVEQARRSGALMIQKKNLSPGDVIMNNLGITHITAVHRLLLNPLNDQQYYRFRLVGGPKFDQFQQDNTSVAVWKAGRWMWKGANDDS